MLRLTLLRRIVLIALPFGLIAHTCLGDTWSAKTLHRVEVGHQAEYRSLQFSSKDTSFYVNSVLMKASQYSAKIINQEFFFSFFSPNRIYDATLREKGFLGINGGFFTPENKPLGLFIVNGKKIAPLSQSRLLSGFVLIDTKSRVRILNRYQLHKNAKNIIQTGPFLIRNGQIAPKKQGQSDRRTAIALTTKGEILVLITSKSTLLDIATVLKNYPEKFSANKIRNAINLDGGTSTAMSLFLPKQRPIVIPEILPVRSGIIFTLK